LHVAIIGNGITGVSAALRIRARRPDWRITLISGESRYHYSRPALMYVFMGHMRYEDTKPFEDSFWQEQRLDLVRGWVRSIDFDGKTLRMHQGPPITWDRLLIATGSKSNRFGWPGQDLDGVQGLWGLFDLKRLEENVRHARHAVITGGGLIGIELAEMLHSRGVQVTFLVREESYWDNVLPREESGMINRHIAEHGLGLRLRTEMKSIEDDGNGRACAVVTGDGERIDCQLVGLTAGVSPNVDLVKDSPLSVGRGILVDWSLRTKLEDVYAAGDCAELETEGDARNVIQQVWYTGKLQGEVAGDVIAGEERTYDPGIWFNSAKFLDLEYQTYGRVNMHVPGERNLYWEHPGGKHAVRVVHDGEGVLGFNVMGIRWRHEVCEAWLRAKAPVERVLADLGRANFDPELYRRFERDVARAFREQLEGQEAPT
jgi:NADPH-dependent 2,4-dienoyl-CoA reductase/sulfur reductase-like enzyme